MPPENREKLKENVGCCKKAKLKKAMMERKDKNARFAPRTDRAAQRRSQEAERPERPEHEGDQLVYGKNPVAELLKSGRGVDTVFLSDTMPPQVAAYYTALAKDAGAVVKRAHTNKLRLMCGTESHQGVAAFASGVEYATLEELLNIAKEKGEAPFIVLSDGVEDPHNLGAIIRTAECAGAHGVIIPKRRSAGVNGTVAKSSAGAVFTMPIARVPNLASCVRMLKEHGVWIWAAEAGGKPYYEQDFKCACALILGSEGEGVSEILKKESDFLAGIPMYGSINSLNVSAAGAIVMFEAARQRNNG